MDYIINLIILVLLTIFISICPAFTDNYEPVEGACEKCSCRLAKDEAKFKHYILNCSAKNMKQILAGWPAQFGDNHTGTELIVSFSNNPIQKLYQLPETAATVSFSCRHCNLTEIVSAIFMDVVNIKRVDLSWNSISGDELRADVFRGRFSNREYEPIPLEDLDISHNLFHTLERRIFEHTPHLKRLSLAYNQFDIIDLTTIYALASVPKLTHLDLSYNHLVTLPETVFHPLRQMRELKIEGNAFKTIPDVISVVTTSLTSLYIGGNPIETITPDSFIGMKILKHLNISAMSELKSVTSGTFAHLQSLETLICKDNPNLTTFDIESLKEAKNLRQLDLSNCNLSKFNADYEFEIPVENRTVYWQNLHTIRLSGNPWNCDCFLAHTLAAMVLYNNASKYSNFKARCDTPYELAGTLLEKLSLERGCQLPSMNMQVIGDPPLDGHPFLRPKAIVLTVVASVVVIAIAFIVGFGIVMVRRKLRQNNTLFTTPIRYTTVRNSTMSTMSSVVPE